jgi:hypothetical protein
VSQQGNRVDVLDPRPHDPDAIRKLELLDRIVKESGTSQERLDQIDPQIGPAQREHQAGQAGSTADIDDARLMREQVGDDGAVEQVPIPQAGHLTRADQAAGQGLRGEEVGVTGGQLEAITEHILGRRGRIGPGDGEVHPRQSQTRALTRR